MEYDGCFLKDSMITFYADFKTSLKCRKILRQNINIKKHYKQNTVSNIAILQNIEDNFARR